MSRVGKAPIKIVQGVKININQDLVQVEGPKGKLSHKIPKGVAVKVDTGSILVTTAEKAQANAVALQGLTRTLISNMVQGVSTGFTRELDIVGVGYRAAVKGQLLTMTLGFSHPVEYQLPAGIAGKVENNTRVVVSGADKVLVGMVAAKIRGFRKPEPYQGKGVKYSNETIIRKQGKAAGSK